MLEAGLDHWYCDTCDEPITNPELGVVVSRVNDSYAEYSFKIVHKNAPANATHCDPGNQAGYTHSMGIDSYLGLEGQQWLLGLLSAGPLKGGPSRAQVSDFNEYVDLFRRLQTPYYEDARRRFSDQEVREKLSDANEIYPYLPEVLDRIVRDQL